MPEDPTLRSKIRNIISSHGDPSYIDVDSCTDAIMHEITEEYDQYDDPGLPLGDPRVVAAQKEKNRQRSATLEVLGCHY